MVGTLTWKGEEFQLFSGVTLLGKAPYAGGQFIKLDHKSISDKHATITYDDGMNISKMLTSFSSLLLHFILFLSHSFLLCLALNQCHCKQEYLS